MAKNKKNLEYYTLDSAMIFEDGVSKFFKNIGVEGKDEMVKYIAKSSSCESSTELEALCSEPEVLIYEYLKWVAINDIQNNMIDRDLLMTLAKAQEYATIDEYE